MPLAINVLLDNGADNSIKSISHEAGGCFGLIVGDYSTIGNITTVNVQKKSRTEMSEMNLFGLIMMP